MRSIILWFFLQLLLITSYSQSFESSVSQADEEGRLQILYDKVCHFDRIPDSVNHYFKVYKEALGSNFNTKDQILIDISTLYCKMYIGTTQPSFSSQYDDLYTRIVATKSQKLLIIYHGMRAMHEALLGNRGNELFHRIKMYQYEKKDNPNGLGANLAAASLASLYHGYEDYDMAIRYASQVTPLVKQHFNGHRVTLHYNLLAMAYQNKQLYDSAIVYHIKTKEIGPPEVSLVWQAIGDGNIGTNYFYQQKYDLAKPLLKAAIDSTVAYHQYSNAGAFAMRLASIMSIQNQYDDATKYFKLAKEYLFKQYGPKGAREYYQYLEQHHKRYNQIEQAYEASDSVKKITAIINQAYDLNTKHTVEANALIELSEEREKGLNAQISLQKYLRNSLLLSLLLLLIIAFFYYRKMKIKSMLKEAEYQHEKSIAQQEITHANELLNNFIENLKNKNTIIENLSEELINEKTMTSASYENKLTLLNDLKQQSILTEEDWKKFSNTFEKAYPGYFITLKDALPDLSAAETRFFALSKLKLNNKDMAAILGISADAIRNTKLRLKRKYAISSDEELDAFLKKF
jgi:tetratricopeptide (TPR) repeat protein/DNA-binding CsgD family transcriptional regulator